MMKTFILIIIIYFVCSLNSFATNSFKTEGFLKYTSFQKDNKHLSLNSISKRSMKQSLQSNPESIINVLEAVVLISGAIYMYKYYDDEVLYNSYKDRGLVLIAIGIGGIVLQMVDSPRSSGNHNYGPRGSLNHKAGLQLCMTGNGLGLKMSF